MKKSIALLTLLFTSIAVADTSKKELPNPFYVFKDRGSKENHYIPAGWMGDTGDLKFNQNYIDDVLDRTNTCIKIIYTAEKKQGANWAGIYWQMPANNWGDKKGGYDLSKYSKLIFKVRGDKGGEYIDKFMMGGITGQTEDGDSDNTETQPIELTTEWKEITLDLKGLDMKHIIGGFGFAVNADMNEKGIVFYLDEIRYEK